MGQQVAVDLRARLRGPRPLLALGVAVLGIGSLVDVVYHAASEALRLTLETFLGVDGELAHLVVFAGMAVVVLGLVELGVRSGHHSTIHAGHQASHPRLVLAERLAVPITPARPDWANRGNQRHRA